MTDEEEQALLGELDCSDWESVRDAVERAGELLGARQVDDLLKVELAARLLRLSAHHKWEVRKAVAQAVLFLRHDAFSAVIARIVEDENAWVREAAQRTLRRRSELTRADIRGDDRGDAVLGLLSALEARYGLRARRAALKIADQLHHHFVREAYHEIVRVIAPLDASLINLEKEISAIAGVPEATVVHVRRAQARVKMITEFLDNLRTFTTDAIAEFTPEDLSSILREAIDLVVNNIELEEERVEVRREAEESLTIDANRTRLLQAIINVIINAVEACIGTGRRGDVRVSARRLSAGHAAIVIADNGCGMSEETLRDCFLLYSSGKPAGMGFGLPLAKKIVEVGHQGTISIESREGVGTTVTIVLPVEQARLEV